MWCTADSLACVCGTKLGLAVSLAALLAVPGGKLSFSAVRWALAENVRKPETRETTKAAVTIAPASSMNLCNRTPG